MCGPEKDRVFSEGKCFLGSLSTDTTSELDVLGHNGHSLGVDGAQVGVLEETNQVSLASLLKGHNGRRLEAKIGLEILGNLTDQPLEWQLADEELSALLVTPDLTEGDSSWPVTMGLLDSTSSRGGFTSGFGSQLLTRGLPSCALSCGLFSTGHFVNQQKIDLKIFKPGSFTLYTTEDSTTENPAF